MRDDLKVLKSKIVEQKELCEENVKDVILTNKEQVKKEIEQFSLARSTGKMEDINKLQAAWEDLRSCFDEISSYKIRTVRNTFYVDIICVY